MNNGEDKAQSSNEVGHSFDWKREQWIKKPGQPATFYRMASQYAGHLNEAQAVELQRLVQEYIVKCEDTTEVPTFESAASSSASARPDLVKLLDEAMDGGLVEPVPYIRLSRVFVAELRLALSAATSSATERNEYICKCGVRVTPHKCSTGTDF